MRCFVRGIFKIVLRKRVITQDFYYPIIYFSICLDFSHICSRHWGVIFFLNLYFHVWVLDFVSIVENLESCRFVVCCL